MLKPSKLLRSSWPKVRPERKNGSVGYLVDARGNGWTGKTRFFFQKKDATTSDENIDLDVNQKSKSDIIEKNSQPNLPFRMINDKINLRNTFKLPPINYLEINLSKKKIGNDESIIAKKNSDLLEKIMSLRLIFTEFSIISNVSFAITNSSWKSFVIPINWLPCPGNTNAVIFNLIYVK